MTESQYAYVGVNHSGVRQGNRAAIFRAIRALGPIARIDLARQSGLNPGTVTNIVDELIAAGLVSEAGQGPSRVGRRPVYLAVNARARYAIGVDIARDAIGGALIDLSGRAVARARGVHGPWPNGAIVAESVAAIVAELLNSLDAAERPSVVGIGIGAPGPLSIRSGRFLAPPTFGTWGDIALRDVIGERFRVPTYVDNNANTSTLAELWFGAGQGVSHFVLLTLGTGVGAGLVLDGELYRGEHDLAGELGHLSIQFDGPRCACGNYGCLELYVAVPRILAALRAALDAGEPSALRDAASGGGGLTLDAAIAAAKAGDRLAGRVFDDVARYLATGLVTIANTFDPQLILLGRDLARADDLLLDPVRAIVAGRVFPALRDSLRIEIAALPDAPAVGAATLALREFFHAPLARL